ncbi:MAG: FtsX-like permease family protein [Planctomycetia bacterium]|nr:FtsX-like permease family protein [Planctomycetia bacterium]
MSYALTTLWHERQRYLPGVLAVAFSALLIALQCGLLLGLFSITSIPIDHSRAHIWLGSAEVLSVDLGRPIPTTFMTRLASEPEVEPPEMFIQGFSIWTKPTGGSDLCIVIGTRLDDDALGYVKELTPELRALLTEPGAIVVDESEISRLGLKHGVGETAEIGGHRVRVVGVVKGLKSMAGPYVFCSIRTARPLLRMSDSQATFLLARCKNPEDAPKVVERLRGYTNMSTFTSDDFSFRSRKHWLLKTKAGIALGYAALLGLLVGGVVTSQTLYAATAASLREYAVLRALGIPRWRMALMVLSQSFWVGLIGTALSIPAAFALGEAADWVGARVMLPPWLLGSAAAITMLMAMLSGMAALRSLRLVEPAILLR